MSDPTTPGEPADDRFAEPPRLVPTNELLVRVQRLLVAMFAAATVLALLPLPPVVHVLVLLVLPVFALVSAISYRDTKRAAFIHRYTRTLWEFRHDRSKMIEVGERAAEPVSAGLRRAWLLMALFVAVLFTGLLLAGLSAGLSERLYG